MDIRKLQRVIVDGLEDLKAQHIAVFNTEHLSALFERVIIASGTSNRQTKALASSVREAVKTAGYPAPRTEGEGNGEWIIIDCGAAVVHVMQPTIRDYYHLEEIWGDKPVNMKLASQVTRLVKAEEAPAPAKKAVTRKAPAAKKSQSLERAPAAGRAPATKAVARKAAGKAVAKKVAPATGTASKKAPAKKSAPPPGKIVTRVVGLKTASKKPGAKVAAKSSVKAPARKAAPSRTTAAKKAPARKTAGRA